MAKKEYDFIISEEGIAEYIFAALIEYGYVPESDEILDLAEIIFEYVIQLLDLIGFTGETIELEDEE